MEKQLVEEIIEKALLDNVSEKQICINLGLNPKNLYYYKKKYNIEICSRGKNINSKKKREFLVNDNFFELPNLINSYWAGFIAADGNISKDFKYLSIGLASKDKIHLENFLNDLNSNYKISSFKVKNKYDTSSIKIMSEKICSDLKFNFNITDNKSLTLIPPNITDIDLIHSFIIGYIDGDGSIGLYKDKDREYLQISLLGTKKICEWIKNIFSDIYEKEIGNISHDKNHNENTFCYKITDKSARYVYTQLYNINVPKLIRKWDIDKLNHCINFVKKGRSNSKYNEILELKLLGLSQTDIGKKLGVTQANISWYYKQPKFIEMEKEIKNEQLDKGESNIEDEN